MGVEKKIERDSVRVAKVHGWKSRKVTSPGTRGAFDRIFIKGGKHIWIEYKDPDTGVIGDLQQEEYEDLIEHGAEAHFVDSVKGTKKILGIHN